MAMEWPGLAVVRRTPFKVVWEGVLAPGQTPYRVRISYELPLPPRVIDLFGQFPLVKVVSPKLEEHPEFEEGPIPHLLHNFDDGPHLCIFDPHQQEWSGDDFIALTTVYWALRWLLRYEGWLATGRWHGRGIHYGRAGRFDPDDGTPLRWNDRWASTTATLAFEASVPNIVDRRWRHKGNVPGFRFERFRTNPVRGLLSGQIL